MGLLVRNRVVLAVLNGILFTIPHLSNPEIAREPGLIALNYLGMGIFLAYITWTTVPVYFDLTSCRSNLK
jgi:uncharacterized protein